MILIQKVANYNEIQAIAYEFAIQNVYELVENNEHERIFKKCNIQDPGLLDKLRGKDKMDHHYYISPAHIPICLEKVISHGMTSAPVSVTFLLKVGLDLQNSDSLKGLADWLAGRIFIDDETFKRDVEETLRKVALGKLPYVDDKSSPEMDLKKMPHLDDMPFHELAGSSYDLKAFRHVLPSWLHWLSVEGIVCVAKEEITKSQAERDQYNKKRNELEREFQKEMENLDREIEKKKAQKVIQDLENELTEKSNEKGNDIENHMRITMLRTVCEDLRASQDGYRRLDTINNESFPADRLVMDVKGIRLELYAKKNVTLGREIPDSDVSAAIPEGADDVGKNRFISSVHARLEHLGNCVRVKNMPRTPSRTNPMTMTSMYLNNENVPMEGKVFAEDVVLGFTYTIHWNARVQRNLDGDNANTVSCLVLNYVGWASLYKVFVWPCCDLKAVDSRLPNWRIKYQSGENGSEGAFYVTTSNGENVYLNTALSVVDGVPISVRS